MKPNRAAACMYNPRLCLIYLILFASASFGQRLDPVQWSLSSDVEKAPPGTTVSLHLTATMEPGWHLYSLTTPKGGPIPTTVSLAENPALESTSLFQPRPDLQRPAVPAAAKENRFIQVDGHTRRAGATRTSSAGRVHTC